VVVGTSGSAGLKPPIRTIAEFFYWMCTQVKPCLYEQSVPQALMRRSVEIIHT